MDSTNKMYYIDGEKYTEEQILQGVLYGGNGEVKTLEDLIQAYHNLTIRTETFLAYLSGIPDSHKLLFRQKIFDVDTIEQYNNYWKEEDNIDDRYIKLIYTIYLNNYLRK